MADPKQTKQNTATGGQTASQCKPAETPAPQTTFAGTPLVNAIQAGDGETMLTFKLNGDITPKVGDSVTITWGKIKRTGVVDRILQNNIVAIISK